MLVRTILQTTERRTEKTTYSLSTVMSTTPSLTHFPLLFVVTMNFNLKLAIINNFVPSLT
jgi:hypothetical protein